VTGDLQAAMAALAAPQDPRFQREAGTTSDLSVDEVLLLHGAGWEPVDLIVGVSWWALPWGTWQYQTGEITQASSGFAGAMETAVGQLRAECAHLGASGVLGVDVEIRVTPTHIDVTLTGTAVRRIGHHQAAFEFLSDLSARDFALLARAGWAPVALVAGASFVGAPRRSASQWAQQQGQNAEMPNLTQALYLARERAMERMQRAGLDAGADGVVGVRLREGSARHSAGGLGQSRVLQFVAFGTAVRLVSDVHQSLSPTLVVTLDDPVVAFEATSLRS